MKHFLLVLVLLLTSCTSEPSEQGESIDAFAPCSSIKTTGMSADGLRVECLDGKGEVALNSIEGPAVISVWASWCSNCEFQRENFIRLFNEVGDQIQVIGIDVEEKSKRQGYSHALRNGMEYPQLYDPDGRTSNYFGPGVPITQFIDAKGSIAFQKVGPITSYQQLIDLIETYLKIDLQTYETKIGWIQKS